MDPGGAQYGWCGRGPGNVTTITEDACACSEQFQSFLKFS